MLHVAAHPPSLARTLVVAAILAALASPGCVADVSGEAVPAKAHLYYPSRMALSADGASAVVVNTNFDQRFVSGWLTHVDLAALVAAGDDANAARAALHPGPRVASLGGPLLVDAAEGRAYLAHRGQGLVTTFELGNPGSAGAPQVWSCGTGDRAGQSNRERKGDCDAAHSFHLQMAGADKEQLGDEPDRDDFLDPFALVQEGPGQLAVAFLGTHRIARLRAGALPLAVETLVHAPEGTRLVDLAAGPNGLLVAAGQNERAESVLLGFGPDAKATTAYSPSQALGRQADRAERGPEAVRLLFAPEQADRLFVLARRPDTLNVTQLVNVAKSTLVGGVVTVQPGPTELRLRHTEAMADQALNEMAYLRRPTGNLVVASSLARDVLYFFVDNGDGLSQAHRMRLQPGSGPAALLPVTVAGKAYLLVSTFFTNGLDLIDISSANLNEFRLHARVQDGKFSPANRGR